MSIYIDNYSNFQAKWPDQITAKSAKKDKNSPMRYNLTMNFDYIFFLDKLTEKIAELKIDLSNAKLDFGKPE